MPKELVKDTWKDSTTDLWSALVSASPAVAAAVRTSAPSPKWTYDSYPGFRPWLLVEFALNTPNRLIRDKLREIREEQEAAGHDQWPTMSKAQVDSAKRDMAAEWQPIRHEIEGQIAQVGIANKTRRLMAYQQMVEELHERMWEERNEKTGQLYLLRDYRETLRAVAEEMGDLGQPAEDEREGLLELARDLAGLLKVQGSGLQDNSTLDATFDYETGEFRVED